MAAETATQVHQALWRLAEGAEVCATMQQIATAAEVGEHIVRRELRSLVELGQIVPAGKRGKSTVFRLSPSSPGAEPPSRRDSPQGGSSSANGRAAAHSPAPQNGKVAEDREHLDSFEFTPELRAEYAAKARAFADRLRGGPPAVLLRPRRNLRDEPCERRRPDISELYFRRFPARLSPASHPAGEGAQAAGSPADVVTGDSAVR